MYTFYCYPRTSSSKCWWLLTELGVPFQEVIVKLGAGEQKKPAYLAINPNGYLPTLVNGDFILTESWAINSYLAEKHRPSLLGATPEERGLVLSWTFWAAFNLYPSVDAIITEKWYGKDDPIILKHHDDRLQRFCAILDVHLAKNRFLTGETMLLCDINVATIFHQASYVEYDYAKFGNIVAWMGRMTALPSFQKLSEWDKRQVE